MPRFLKRGMDASAIEAADVDPELGAQMGEALTRMATGMVRR